MNGKTNEYIANIHQPHIKSVKKTAKFYLVISIICIIVLGIIALNVFMYFKPELYEVFYLGTIISVIILIFIVTQMYINWVADLNTLDKQINELIENMKKAEENKNELC